MEGHKVALGLFLALIASGCAGMTGESTESPGFDNLTLNLDEVENITGTNYSTETNNSTSEDFNISSVTKKVSSFFIKDENLSEAPESVQSMVYALNSSDNDGNLSSRFNRTTIKGYQARKLESTNETLLYGEEGNISFFVRTKGDEGLFSSSKELYIEIAQKVEEFNENQS